jgi:N-acetylglucosaminyldiphosphoundecaprenol N-acetyl-beta-D-mannosaminyltransferase
MANVDVLGVGVAPINEAQLLNSVGEALVGRRGSLFAYVNVNAINLAGSNPWFRDFLNGAECAYCDGEGVRFGAGILGRTIPARIALTYFFWDICAEATKKGYSIYLLGSHDHILAEAVTKIRARFPAIRIAGTHHGYFEKNGKPSDDVVASVNAAAPDLLFVGFGMPLQEEWIRRYRSELKAGAIFPCGSMIDYASGKKSIAPLWMRKNGMEWIYRLFQEPGRLWKRYLVGNPLFMARVIRQRLREGS